MAKTTLSGSSGKSSEKSSGKSTTAKSAGAKGSVTRGTAKDAGLSAVTGSARGTTKTAGAKSERALYRNINRELDRDLSASADEENVDESVASDGSAPQPLSVKEKSVLEFLEVYISTQGVSPTYSEICKHFGFASFNSVQRYLKQLEVKGYIRLPWSNQKRAITLLHSSSAIQDAIQGGVSLHSSSSSPASLAPKGISKSLGTSKSAGTSDNVIPLASSTENFALPLLGRVAAGSPIEAMEHDEFIDVPASLVRYADRTYALRVQGQSMIEDGILDGDVILVQRQSSAVNGEIVVAMVGEEATVKRFYMHRGIAAAAHSARSGNDFDDDMSDGTYDETSTSDRFKQGPGKKIELRPANSTMQSMWFDPSEIQIRGIVVGLIRKFF